MNFLSGLGRTFSGKSNATVDYDEEGRQLWAKLNLENSNRSASVWNPADPIWRHPTGNGIIYVGNQTAAENITYLK